MTNLHEIANRFVGTTEVPGKASNPAIMAMLKLDSEWPKDDVVPWCSGAMNYWAWLLGLPRSRSLRARSWLKVGEPIDLDEARPFNDIVIFARGGSPLDPNVIEAPGHVALFHKRAVNSAYVFVLGGNQRDTVNISSYRVDQILGVRRLFP